MQSILTRPAKEVDIRGFLNLAEAMGEVPSVWAKDPESDFHRYVKAMKEDKLMFLLAITEQEKSVGFSTVKFFKRLDPSAFDAKSCTVGVAVHPDYRRRGIGSKLVEYGLEEGEKTRSRYRLHIDRNREHGHAKTCGEPWIHQICSIGRERMEISQIHAENLGRILDKMLN